MTINSPANIGIIHFIGIGGIGMSGIAEIMHNLNYQIQGSDLTHNANASRLENMGIKVFIGHQKENVAGAKVVVISSAVKSNNPELVQAREMRIPVIKRAEMLAELMRLKSAIAIGGTHGKTTTTSLIGHLLTTAKFDPTIVNGGIINSIGSNAYLGKGDWIVVEADESDGSFTKLPATVTVVTNIDPEHMEHYGTVENLHAAFDHFVTNIPFYGFAVLCIDHPEVKSMISRIEDRRLVTYGLSPQADVTAVNIEASKDGFHFDAVIKASPYAPDQKELTIKNIHLPMFGIHNVLNSLATIATGHQLGISPLVIKSALHDFSGVKRRFTITGEVNGITVVDDYGHHPVEISAVLKAARQACSHKVYAIIQPHRYTRLSSLFEDFCTCCDHADTIIVADVYSAGEPVIEGYNKMALAEGIKKHGHREVLTIDSFAELPALLGPRLEANDFVIFLGAGDITKAANQFPEALKSFYESGAQQAKKA